MRGTRIKIAGIALVGLAFGTSNMFATALPITDSGLLTIGNLVGSLVGVTSAPPCINWSGGATCAGATHQMSVSGVSNLFSTTTTSTDTIKDVSTTPVSSFETVLGAGALAGQTIIFDLTSIPVNPGPSIGCTSNAPFATCTPAGSPFTFSENATGTQVSITFSTLMNVYTGSSTTGFTAYQGIFSTQQSGTVSGLGACNGVTANITSILACEGSGGTVTATWSANESPIPSSGTPEPISFVLFGSGLVGLALIGRRYKRS